MGEDAFLEPATDPTPPLAGPFALCGFVGAWLTADAFGFGRSDNDVVLRGFLTVVTPVVAATLGSALASSRYRGGGLAAQGMLLAFIAGAINGGIVGAVLAGGYGLVIGAIFGACVAFPFMPGLAVVLAAARMAAGARAGTVAAAVSKRAPWSAALGVCAAAMVLLPRASWAREFPPLRAGFAWAMVAAAAVLVALDVRAARAIARLRRSEASAAEDPERAAELGVAVDYGVGGGVREYTARRGGAYREESHGAARFTGDGAYAASWVRAAIGLGVVAVAAAGYAAVAGR